MRVVWNIFVVLALMAGAAEAGYLLGHRAASSPGADADNSGDDVAPTPVVQTVPIRQGHVDQKIVVYGVVTAQTSDVEVLSVPFESRVKKIMAVAGQRLDSSAPVIEVEASLDTQLQLKQAESAVQAAQKDLDQTHERFINHLATNQDLLQSQQNLDLAKLKFDAMKKEGADKPQELSAAGLVSKVDVQEGQVVAAGGALVEVAGDGKLQVRLGVEPVDAARIRAGDSVALSDTRSDGAPITAKVRMVSQRINPESRLIDVFVSLPEDSPLALDSYVRGEMAVTGERGLVVPRSAVLPDDNGYSLFTVDQGKAVEHKVTIGMKNDETAQITGDGLAEGQPVVILGNFELADGMGVKTTTAEGPTTMPAPVQEAGQ